MLDGEPFKADTELLFTDEERKQMWLEDRKLYQAEANARIEEFNASAVELNAKTNLFNALANVIGVLQPVVNQITKEAMAAVKARCN